MQQDELAELKKSVTYISNKLDELTASKTEITEILQLVKKLEKTNVEKDAKIKQMEIRINDLEQYSRMENVIISGLQTTHLNYSRVVDQSATAHETDNENGALEDNVVAFFNEKLKLAIRKSDISVCHTLKRKTSDNVRGSTQTKDIIVRFVSRRTKTAVMRNARCLKGTKIYVNEHLTTRNAALAKTARRLQRENKISFTWVRNGKVFVKSLGSPETASVHAISDERDFVTLRLL